MFAAAVIAVVSAINEHGVGFPMDEKGTDGAPVSTWSRSLCSGLPCCLDAVQQKFSPFRYVTKWAPKASGNISGAVADPTDRGFQYSAHLIH
jgi:hypothetical protein